MNPGVKLDIRTITLRPHAVRATDDGALILITRLGDEDLPVRLELDASPTFAARLATSVSAAQLTIDTKKSHETTTN